ATTTSSATTIRVLPGPASTPFGGAPAVIPGLIEAENFNDGGEGVGYHDLTTGNAGGAYRSTDVDIQPTVDIGGGFNVGFIEPGEGGGVLGGWGGAATEQPGGPRAAHAAR